MRRIDFSPWNMVNHSTEVFLNHTTIPKQEQEQNLEQDNYKNNHI